MHTGIAGRLRLDHLELPVPFRFQCPLLHAGNDGLRGRRLLEPREECRHRRFVALDFHHDASRVIADVTGQPAFRGIPVHRWAETDALHAAGNLRLDAGSHISTFVILSAAKDLWN
jgi:hypothetical protein